MSNKRAWHWIFGSNAHISFSTGTGVAASGPTDPDYLVASEGCDSVSDPQTGDFLFWTSGSFAYDSNYNNITPPDGVGGTPTIEPWLSMQSITVVKAPGASTLYYLFFVGNWTTNVNNTYPIRYRTLDVDGYVWGSIVNLDGSIGTSGGPGYAENLTAGLQANGTDWWIITKKKNNNEIKIWPLTASGVGTVITRTISFTTTGANRFGQIKVSPSGTRLALGLGGTPGSTGTNPVATVWDFDNSTATLSNERILLSAIGEAIPNTPTQAEREAAQVIGIDFSPNSSILYVNGYATGVTWKIILWNDTCYTVYKHSGLTLNGYGGAVQLGPDGRIYFAASGQPHVRRIYSPDSEEDTLPLSNLNINNNTIPGGSPSSSTLGLPVVPQIPDAPDDYRVYYNGTWYSICAGDVIRLWHADTSTWVELDIGDKYWNGYEWRTISCSLPTQLDYDCYDIISFHTPESLGYDPPFNSSGFTTAKVASSVPITTGGRRIAGSVYNGYYTVTQVNTVSSFKYVTFQRTYTATTAPHKFIL